MISPIPSADVARLFVAFAVAFIGALVMLRMDASKSSRRYLPAYAPMTLLGTALFLWVLARLFPRLLGWAGGMNLLFLLIWLLGTIGASYILLLLLRPLLRRFVSGRGRAALWTMPCALGCFLHVFSTLTPRRIVRLDDRALLIGGAVWACGAAGVMIWRTAAHLRFRRELLAGARPVSEDAERILREEENRLGAKRVYTAVIAPAARSPLSVGLLPRSIRIALPERAWSDEDLALIFRHELIHILRQDNQTKLFLTVCAAVSWFNPLIWLAVSRAGEDFEAGCDELVLGGADDETRERYAELILSSSGDARGFTTCLSPRAVTLRERLRDIVTPQKRAAGAVSGALLMAVIALLCGQTAFAYGNVSAETVIFDDLPLSAYTVTACGSMDSEGRSRFGAADGDALLEYLAGLRLRRMTGCGGSYPHDGDWLLYFVYLQGPNGTVLVEFTAEGIVLCRRSDDGAVFYHTSNQVYVLDGESDLDGAARLMEPLQTVGGPSDGPG